MSMLEHGILVVACTLASLAQAQTYNLGRTPTAREIAGWNIDVAPDGVGLPPGSGTVRQGGEIFASQCSGCHGAKGEGGVADRLVGGIGSLKSDKPLKTVGSFWPYATTLYDYIHRAMPFNAPQSLTADQVYAVAAYVLYLNKIVSEDAVLDAKTLAKVQMPNRNGFTSPDPRPDIKTKPCMKDCR